MKLAIAHMVLGVKVIAYPSVRKYPLEPRRESSCY